jgi:PTH2 family peptidyl-tRNA hydrolase
MKQVIVVNTALNMPAGKMAAQVAHAAVAALLSALPEAQQGWLRAGMPKVVLKVDTEEALHELQKAAAEAGLPAYLVRDSGRTVLEPGTVTCLGIGPAEIGAIDAVTGKLKLL